MGIAFYLLRRCSLRHWRMAPGQNLILVFILALGVGVFTAIRLANRAAVASFVNFTDTLIGQSDWIIESPSGSLKETLLPQLRDALGTRPVAIVPVVETTAARPLKGSEEYFERETYTVLGVDLIAVSNLASVRAAAASVLPSGDHVWAEFQGGNRVWVPPALAGQPQLRLVVNDRLVDLTVAGAIRPGPGAPAPPENLFVMDLPQLQRLAGKKGELDRVEFVVADGPGIAERRAELGALLTRLGGDGERWLVRTPGARRETAEKMTEAFRLNLTILSLIALLVGLYLIFQALDGAVVRRRGEIAILRSLGLDESVIRRLWLLEAAALGLVGGALGVGLGWLGAQGAVRAVGRTVNTLYFATTVKTARLDPFEFWFGLAIGVVASVAAGWYPAKEAAQTPPAQILNRSLATGASLWRTPWIGLAAIAVGALLIKVPPIALAGGSHFPLAGYLSALAWILGGGLVFAGALPEMVRWFRGMGAHSAALRVALGHLGRPSGRHRMAVASLLCAVGMSAGMAILVSSFEGTVKTWVAHSLQADLYLYSAGARSASADNRIPSSTWKALASHAGIDQAWLLAAYPLQLGTGAATLLTGTDLHLMHSRADLPWVEAPRDEAIFQPGRNASLALVSESFSERFSKHRGDTLSFPTPAGTQTVTIAGVFSDYGNERGSIMVPWDRIVAWMGSDSATHISLFVRKGVNPDAMRAALKKEFPGLQVFTHTALRREILQVFRQTFTITYALEVIAVVVAVVGLALAMASVLLDRREELTSLRSLGFGRREMAFASSVEGLVLAAWAMSGGLLLSLGLGWLLIHVINKQSFGWTLGFALPWRQLAILVAAVSFSGWGVTYLVGLWGANLPADQEE